MVANVVSIAVGSSVNYSQAAAQVVDFYLDESREKERADIVALCNRDDADAKELLKGYVREAMRMNPQFGGLFRNVVEDDTIDQGPGLEPMQVKAGDLIFANFLSAHMNVRNSFISVYCLLYLP